MFCLFISHSPEFEFIATYPYTEEGVEDAGKTLAAFRRWFVIHRLNEPYWDVFSDSNEDRLKFLVRLYLRLIDCE